MKAKRIPSMNQKDIVRFISSINFLTENSCWDWIKTINNGYGEFYFLNGDYPAHRVAYEFFKKEVIPTDMTLDHLCRNKLCVNPKHLEVITLQENARRSIYSRYEEFCKNGHPFSGENLHIRKNGWRVCKRCRADNMRKLRNKLAN